MTGPDREIVEHYTAGAYEHERLRIGGGRLELARTKELLQRYLPEPPASVLDVGGGPGVYASWLSDAGYRVQLVDAVELHVEQAREAGTFTAALGDARALEQPDASVDVVLLLGPLYHLTERVDRLRALQEARRVLPPGGLLAAAAISRWASLLDGTRRGHINDEEFRHILERGLSEGQHRNPTNQPEWFTTSYFHRPEELRAEVTEAGFTLEGVFGVEGPGWLLSREDQNARWADERGRESLLYVARLAERDPGMASMSAHLLAIARA